MYGCQVALWRYFIAYQYLFSILVKCLFLSRDIEFLVKFSIWTCIRNLLLIRKTKWSHGNTICTQILNLKIAVQVLSGLFSNSITAQQCELKLYSIFKDCQTIEQYSTFKPSSHFRNLICNAKLQDRANSSFIGLSSTLPYLTYSSESFWFL